MGKTNWSRVFLGGLLAGVVMNVFVIAASAVYLGKLWRSALQALNVSAGVKGDHFRRNKWEPFLNG